jgi:plasmid stabilization system protein ParE
LKAYRYLEEADQEFQEHIGYFDGVSRTVARNFVDDVEAAVNEIRQYPQIGAPLSRQVRKRVLTGFKYSILYVDTPNEIIIVAVAPHKRRPGYWRRRLRHLNR